MNGQCPIGDLDFNTQSSIDSFSIQYPNCTNLSNQVIVQGNGITNLNGFSNVEVFSGFFWLHDTNISSLTGLNSLDSIGECWIWSNPKLQTLNGLEGLTKAKVLWISSNDTLKFLVSPEQFDYCRSDINCFRQQRAWCPIWVGKFDDGRSGPFHRQITNCSK